MPRFALTAAESSLLGVALLQEARARNLPDSEALVAAANTTMAELRALVQNRLMLMRDDAQTALNAVDSSAAARKAALSAEIASIDSALAKL